MLVRYIVVNLAAAGAHVIDMNDIGQIILRRDHVMDIHGKGLESVRQRYLHPLDRQRKEDRDDVPDSVSLVTTFIFDT
jgi:hypothetical protein